MDKDYKEHSAQVLICVHPWLKYLYIFSAIIYLLMLTNCVKRVNERQEPENQEEEIIIKIDPLQVRAYEIASAMDEKLLASQVLVSGIEGKGKLSEAMRTLLLESPPGGVMLFRYNLDTDNDSIRALVAQTVNIIVEESGVPPFMAVDHEGRGVNRFLPGVADMPPAKVYRDLFNNPEYERKDVLKKIEEDCFNTAEKINNLGVNVNFAPVAETLHSHNMEFMESRSYGSDSVFTSDAANAFIRGMERAGVMCVVKHFPGSAGEDPHYSASVIDKDNDSLNELVSPFGRLIKQGARAIMIAHTLVPAKDDMIASLSPLVMERWLRQELGFTGIIISDDFSMAAAGGLNPEESAVRSIASGSDMVLVWPRDLSRTHKEIMLALEDGRLSSGRLIESVTRIIYEKLRMGLILESSNDANGRE
jgi:beta-N-acetylhexosaminidase